MLRCGVLAIALAACGGDGASHPQDARQVDALTDGTSCSRVLFVNFEGASIIGGGIDDAPTNTSSIPRSGTFLVPPYRMGDSTRTTKIATITSQVMTTLGAYATVVTTRPASGNYHMVVVGGQPQDLGYLTGTPAVGNTGPCATGVPRAIDFVFDDGGTQLAREANFIISMYGLSKSLPMSTVVTDCMCVMASTCLPSATTACSIGGAGTPRDTNNSTCGSGATFDEMAAFQNMPCD